MATNIKDTTIASTYDRLVLVQDGNDIGAGTDTMNIEIQTQAGVATATPLYISTNRIGIGVAAPDNALEILGPAYASRGAATNTIWGYNAGQNLDGNSSNSLRNTFIGYEVGDATLNAASDNTGVGHATLTALTEGDGNTAIGQAALTALTTGLSNTCIGYQAGDAISTTSYNTAVGVLALSAAGTATSTAVGFSALKVATAGSNTAVGSNAGLAVSDGTDNSFFGYNAGASSAGGDGNICIGSESNCDATTDKQIAIGYSTVANGAYAIAIGENIEAATNTFVFGKAGNIATSSTFASSSACTFAFSSDERRKTNIQDATLGLEFINKLKTRTFKWKPAEEHPEEWHHWEDLKDEDGELTGEKEYYEMDTDSTMHGFIAQEVKAVLDEYGVTDSMDVWAEDKNGQQRMSEQKFIIPLVKAVQELSAKVTALENA